MKDLSFVKLRPVGIYILIFFQLNLNTMVYNKINDHLDYESMYKCDGTPYEWILKLNYTKIPFTS